MNTALSFNCNFKDMDFIDWTNLSIEKGLAFIDGLLFISEMKTLQRRIRQ